MTRDRDFKRIVRRRAHETGERYTEARSSLEGMSDIDGDTQWLVVHTFPDAVEWVREWLLGRFPSDLSEVLLPHFRGEIFPPGLLVLRLTSKKRLSKIARGCWFTGYAGSPDAPLPMSWERVKQEIEKEGKAALIRRARNERELDRFRRQGRRGVRLGPEFTPDVRLGVPTDFHLDLDPAAESELLDRIEAGERTARALEQQVEQLTQVGQGIADIVTAREHMDIQIEELERRAAEFRDQARKAMMQNREDLAREARKRRASIAAQLEQLRGQREQLGEQESRLIQTQNSFVAKRGNEAEALRFAAADGVDARRVLVEAYRPLVDTAVAAFIGTTRAKASELDAAGLEGLSMAIDRFASTRGARFLPFAWWWIRQSILRHLATTGAV